MNCQFYDRRSARPGDGRAPLMWGQCRRHSPHLNPLGPSAAKAHMVEGVWPLVRDDDWCGEWRAPLRAAVARVRFAPRSVESSSAGNASAAAPTPVSPELAVATAD